MVTHYNDSSVTKSNRKYCSKSYKNLSKAYNDLSHFYIMLFTLEY